MKTIHKSINTKSKKSDHFAPFLKNVGYIPNPTHPQGWGCGCCVYKNLAPKLARLGVATPHAGATPGAPTPCLVVAILLPAWGSGACPYGNVATCSRAHKKSTLAPGTAGIHGAT